MRKETLCLQQIELQTYKSFSRFEPHLNTSYILTSYPDHQT